MFLSSHQHIGFEKGELGLGDRAGGRVLEYLQLLTIPQLGVEMGLSMAY